MLRTALVATTFSAAFVFANPAAADDAGRAIRGWHTGCIKGCGHNRTRASVDLINQGRVVGFDQQLDPSAPFIINRILGQRGQAAKREQRRIVKVVGVPRAGH